jgi:DNA helicase II / ATP-dependent DNA helicase PcrA
MMPESDNQNEAGTAAAEAIQQVFSHIDSGKSFIMEAGAGAGKTYSLKQALHYAINLHGNEITRRNQQVACITYTEAATDELRKDLDNHPAIWISTIHAFCWSLLKDFQPALREALTQLPRWQEKITEMEQVGQRKITYDQGYRKYDENELSLDHDDIPALTVILMGKAKFCDVFIARFPILFIDEYQDTDQDLMEALKTNFLDAGKKLQLGLFGDHWQRIYDGVCGEVTHEKLPIIKKHANFRSNKQIVECLNRMRPELEQFANNGDTGSDVRVYHTNNWRGAGERGTGPHHIGSLPDEAARMYFESVKTELKNSGWDLSADKTKVLLLTNSMLAKEQGYQELLNCFPFPYTDRCLRKEDDYIKFFAEILEPACEAYQAKKYGQMFSAIGNRIHIKSHADKLRWTKDMDALLELRKTGSIGQVVDLLLKTRRPRLPERVVRKEEELKDYIANTPADPIEELQKKIERLTKFRAITYSEVTALVKYIDGKTPFSTKHKVKGAEFENVLIVFSQGWSKYNFNTMLECGIIENAHTDKDRKFFENNRNLFYVVCSRPKQRLALLFTHELSVNALSTLSSWFGEETVREA